MAAELEQLRIQANSLNQLRLTVTQQVDRLINQLGFHRAVYPDFNPEEAVLQYRRDFDLPTGAAMPEEYKGRFDQRILVVDPRVKLSTLHQQAGVTEYIDTSAITNLTKVPRVPYVTFTHDSQKYRRCSIEQALVLAGDEVGRPQVEISHHYLQFPRDFTKNGMVGMNAAGSRYGDRFVPCLVLLSGRPEVHAHWINDTHLQRWGAGSRGKDVIELGVR